MAIKITAIRRDCNPNLGGVSCRVDSVILSNNNVQNTEQWMERMEKDVANSNGYASIEYVVQTEHVYGKEDPPTS